MSKQKQNGDGKDDAAGNDKKAFGDCLCHLVLTGGGGQLYPLYCNLFYYPADFSRISEPERIGTDQPVFLWLDGTGRRCGEYSSVFCSPYVFPSAAFGTLYELKVNFLSHLAKVPLGFHVMIGSGKLRKITDENIENVEKFIAHQLPDIVAAFVSPVVMAVILLSVDWRLGLAQLLE